ncbi:oligosaccharide flippase family protein [Lelliottia amnigena]
MKFVGGNALAQIIIILGTPILTRLYSPDDFGVYASFMSIILILGVIASGRYDQIMYNFDQEDEWITCFCNGVIIAIVLSVVMLFGFGAIYFFVDESSLVYFLIPPSVLTFAVIQLYTSFYSLTRQYKTIIILNFLRSSTIIILQYILYKNSSWGLALGFLLSQVICIIYCMFVSKVFYKKINFNFFMKKNATLSSMQSLSNSFSSQLPVFVIPGQYGFAALGFYGLAIRLTQIPITFFTNAVRPYILGELNKNKRDNQKIYKILWLSSLMLLILGALGIILINLFATSFFKIYAGETWADAGEIAGILSWWLLVAFANVTSTSYLTIMGRFKSLFIYDSVLLIFRSSVALYSVYYHLSFVNFLYLYSMLGMIFNFGIIIYAIKCGYKNARYINCNS